MVQRGPRREHDLLRRRPFDIGCTLLDQSKPIQVPSAGLRRAKKFFLTSEGIMRWKNIYHGSYGSRIASIYSFPLFVPDPGRVVFGTLNLHCTETDIFKSNQ